MYCMAMKKKPKLAKNRKVMPAAPVAKSGRMNSRTSSSGCRRRSSTITNTRASATPAVMHPHTTGSVHPRTGASTTPNTKTATAPPMSRAPTQSTGVAVSSREDRMVHVQTNSPRLGDRKGVEDRLPSEEVQQHSGSHEPDDRTGTRDPRPDADRLVALVLREGGGQQRQRGGHDERRADARDGARDDDLHRAVEDVGASEATREDRQSDEQRTAPPVPVAECTGGQQQAGEHQRVSVDHPGELRLGRRSLERDVGKRSVQRDHRGDHQQDIDSGDRQQPEPAEFRQGGQVGVDILVGPDEGVDHDRRSLSIGYFRD